MFKTKAIKLLVLAVLLVTLVTGCKYSSGNNSSEGSTANPSSTAPEATQSDSQEEQKENIKTSYEDLETKYREFAGDIAQIEGELIDDTKLQDDRTCTTENSCFTLYQLLKNLQGESSQTDIKKAYLGESYKNFQALDQEINNFKNNDAVKGLISSEDLQALEISDELRTIMGYFQDNILSVDEIKKIQNKDNPESSDGVFGPNTYNKLKTILVRETQELNKQLQAIKANLEKSEPDPPTTDIQSRISSLEEQIVTQQQQIESLNQQINNSQAGGTNIPIWLYLAAGLGLLLGIFGAITSVINSLKSRQNQIQISKKLKDYDRRNRQNIDVINQNIDLLRNEIAQVQNQSSTSSYSSIYPGTSFKKYSPDRQTKSGELDTLSGLDSENQTNYIDDNYTSKLSNPSFESRLSSQKSEYSITPTNYTPAVNLNNFSEPGTKVRMTPDTTNQVLGGTFNNNVELEENRRGEYLVLSNDRYNEYLILNPEVIFNPQTLTIMNKSRLFICRGDLATTRKGKDIQVIEPAKVEKTNEGWRLVESGEIQL